MSPTPHLRFILRGAFSPTAEQTQEHAYKTGLSQHQALVELKQPGQRILQQLWDDGQWRDIPLAEENAAYIITVIDNTNPNGIPYEDWVRK